MNSHMNLISQLIEFVFEKQLGRNKLLNKFLKGDVLNGTSGFKSNFLKANFHITYRVEQRCFLPVFESSAMQ